LTRSKVIVILAIKKRGAGSRQKEIDKRLWRVNNRKRAKNYYKEAKESGR
jgi:hypothetical protein